MFQTRVGSVQFLGLQITLTFGFYVLFGLGFLEDSFFIFFGPMNVEFQRAKKAQ